MRITTCRSLYVACMRCFQPDSGTTIATEKLLKISAPNSLILPSTKLLKLYCSLRASFVWLAYESNYVSAANSMPSDRKNGILVSLKVAFRQFCAGPSRERRYRVRSPIFRLSDDFRIVIGLCYHSLVPLKLLPHRWHPFHCTPGVWTCL